MIAKVSFNEAVQDWTQKESINQIGTSHRVYIAWKGGKWEIVKLNPFFQFLRNRLGFFSSTHLKTLGPKLYELDKTALSPKASELCRSVSLCWARKFQDKNASEYYPVKLADDNFFIEVFQLILDRGINELTPHLDKEGLFRSSGSCFEMEFIQKHAFDAVKQKHALKATLDKDNSSYGAYAGVIKRFTVECSSRLAHASFLQLTDKTKLKDKITRLRKLGIDYEKKQKEEHLKKSLKWDGWKSVSFNHLSDVCVKLRLEEIPNPK